MLWLLACGEGVQSVEDTATDAVIEETELSYQFTIAILADPHISGTPEHTARLKKPSPGSINTPKKDRLSWFLYLVTWVWGEGLTTAKDLLGNINRSYLPIIGDNEIIYGDGSELCRCLCLPNGVACGQHR